MSKFTRHSNQHGDLLSVPLIGQNEIFAFRKFKFCRLCKLVEHVISLWATFCCQANAAKDATDPQKETITSQTVFYE